MANKKVIPCRVCGEEIPRWYRTKAGKTRSGFIALRDHIIREHPAEAETMGLITPDEEEPAEVLWDPEEDSHEGDGNRQGWELMQLYSG